MAGSIFYSPYFWWPYPSGEPIPGALLAFFISPGTTPAATYSNPNLTTPNANPVVADGDGIFPVIYLDPAVLYRAVLSYPSDGINPPVQIWAANNVADFAAQGFAPIDSPSFTGEPEAPTPPLGDDSSRLATTDFVTRTVDQLAQTYAPIESPDLTGAPTAPTADPGTSDTQIATTAFVAAAIVPGGSTNFSANGFVVEPSGYVRQWGFQATALTAPNQSVAVTFPMEFPNACFGAHATIDNSAAAASVVTGISLNGAPTQSGATFLTAGYQSGAYTSVPGFYWEAWGH